MKRSMFCALVGLTLVAASLAAQTSTTAPAPVPEEARKHFIMGATLFKDAKTPEDYAQVENEFKQAADLAPQWPDARYNLAMAKEAAGDYDGAMADLKLYQQLKLSDADARTAQDKIYEVEAKQAKANDPAAKERERIAKSTKEIRQAQLTFSALIQKLDGAVFIGFGTYETTRYKSKLHFRRNAETGLLECATSELILQSNDPKSPVTGQWTQEETTFLGVHPESDTDFMGCVVLSTYRMSSDGRVLDNLFNGQVKNEGGLNPYYRQ